MSFLTERYFQVLDRHRIYSFVRSPLELKYFMERHVICVWGYHRIKPWNDRRAQFRGWSQLGTGVCKRPRYWTVAGRIVQWFDACVDTDCDCHSVCREHWHGHRCAHPTSLYGTDLEKHRTMAHCGTRLTSPDAHPYS